MNERESTRPLTHRDAQWPERNEYDDEISLFDLWAVLVRRRWLIAGVVLVVLAMGIGYAFLSARTYRYSATITLGKVLENGDVQPVASAESTVAQIKQVYLPASIRQVVGDPQQAAFLPKISVSSPEGSDLVLLEEETTAGHADALKKVVTSVAKLVADDQSDVIDAARQRAQSAVTDAEQRLKYLEGRTKALQSDLDQLDRREQAFDQRRKDLHGELASLKSQRDKVGSKGGEAYLMSLNSEMARIRDEMSSIEDQLLVQIPNARSNTRMHLAQARSDVESQKAKVAEAKSQLKRIKPTRLTAGPSRSFHPTGVGHSVIVALAIVLGIMLGVFAAFLWEFVTRANEYMRSTEGH